jgi:UBX domain-containing protein 6
LCFFLDWYKLNVEHSLSDERACLHLNFWLSCLQFVASTLRDPSESFDLILPALPKPQVIPRFPDHTGRCRTMEEAELVPKALLKFHPTGPQGYTCLKSECYKICEPL